METVGGSEMGGPVGERLHERAKNLLMSLKQKSENEREMAKMKSNQRHATGHSRKIMEGKKRKKFQEIFELLDSDCDGKINALKINIGGLAPGMLELISPLLC